MKLEIYNSIIAQSNKLPSRDALSNLKAKFPNIPDRTLGSLISQEYQRKMKKTHFKHHTPEAMQTYYTRYLEMLQKSEQPGSLTKLADEFDLSPSLMARIILEQHMASLSDGQVPARQHISKLMKNTTLIQDGKLSLDVHYSILDDDNYGPLADSIKHSIGQQYEFKLKKQLQDLAIPFDSEDQLRVQGFDKTPDTKLEIPIAVNGHVVNWIESKASFGDSQNHETYLKEQFWSYWNRFGPGLVIYWFGFIDELDVHGDKGIQLCDEFPRDIVFMMPENIPFDS